MLATICHHRQRFNEHCRFQKRRRCYSDAMQIDFLLFGSGIILEIYGGLIIFSPRFASYIEKISINKHLFSGQTAKYSIWYFEGAMSLGAGAAMILAAFIGS